PRIRLSLCSRVMTTHPCLGGGLRLRHCSLRRTVHVPTLPRGRGDSGRGLYQSCAAVCSIHNPHHAQLRGARPGIRFLLILPRFHWLACHVFHHSSPRQITECPLHQPI